MVETFIRSFLNLALYLLQYLYCSLTPKHVTSKFYYIFYSIFAFSKGLIHLYEDWQTENKLNHVKENTGLPLAFHFSISRFKRWWAVGKQISFQVSNLMSFYCLLQTHIICSDVLWLSYIAISHQTRSDITWFLIDLNTVNSTFPFLEHCKSFHANLTIPRI